MIATIDPTGYSFCEEGNVASTIQHDIDTNNRQLNNSTTVVMDTVNDHYCPQFDPNIFNMYFPVTANSEPLFIPDGSVSSAVTANSEPLFIPDGNVSSAVIANSEPLFIPDGNVSTAITTNPDLQLFLLIVYQLLLALIWKPQAMMMSVL